MSAPEVAAGSQAVSQEITKGIQDIRTLSTCKICTRLMYEPYTTKCGHTFCYGCLSKWLGRDQRKKQCPDCRAKIKDEPSPNYTIREIVHVLISNSAFIDDDETPESLRAEQLQEASQLEKDKTRPDGLFRGLFPVGHHTPIQDAADGVMRCPHCNWEVRDDFCNHCGAGFDDNFWADWTDDEDYDSEADDLNDGEDTGDGYDVDSEDTDEPNEEDEAFIDDGDLDHERVGYIAPRGFPYDETAPPNEGYEGYESSVSSGSLRLARWRFRQTREARTGSEDSTLGVSDPETIDSDGDSGISSGSGDDDGSSEDDSESDSEDQSSGDSDPEPILGRRGRPSSQRHASNQRSQTQRQHSNIIDLTTLPSPSIVHSRQERTTQSTGGDNNVGPATVSTSRNSILRGEQNLDDGSGTDTPLPVRPRKRVRIVLSDSEGDDDPVDVQRDSRPRRRRLNHQSNPAAALIRSHQRLPITYSSSSAIPSTFFR